MLNNNQNSYYSITFTYQTAHILRWNGCLKVVIKREEGQLGVGTRHLKKIWQKWKSTQLELCKRNCERSFQMEEKIRPMSHNELKELSLK